jgi:hypothetical protein
MGGPPVYHHGLFEHSIDTAENSLDNTFKANLKDTKLENVKYSQKGNGAENSIHRTSWTSAYLDKTIHFLTLYNIFLFLCYDHAKYVYITVGQLFVSYYLFSFLFSNNYKLYPF